MNTTATKIEKQVVSLQSKIDGLSGPRLTNTPKRQREQRQRDTMIERYRLQIHTLQYLAEETACRDLTPMEQGLLVGAFHEDLRGMLARKKYDELHNLSRKITFPVRDTAQAKRLRKAGITDDASLWAALCEYEALVEKATVPENPRVARIRDLTYQAQFQQGGDIQFTPSELAARMVETAGLEPGSHVLEPEAGTGAIADEAKKVTPNVDCIERVYDFRELLELKGHRVIGHDFLLLDPRPQYDAILMNPPFSDEYRHLQHAYGFLKPGGVLVSVCSNRVLHPVMGRKHQEFQEWLRERDYRIEETGARFEMTGISTILLTLRKPTERQV